MGTTVVGVVADPAALVTGTDDAGGVAVAVTTGRGLSAGAVGSSRVSTTAVVAPIAAALAATSTKRAAMPWRDRVASAIGSSSTTRAVTARFDAGPRSI